MTMHGGIMKYTKAAILIGLLLSIQACSLGGGTMGTGVVGGNTYGTGGSQLDANLLNFNIKGSLLSSSGSGVKGAHITAKTANAETHAVSHADGSFHLPLAIASGEEIVFLVNTGNKKLFCSTTISPAGENEVKAEFRVSPAGKLSCP